MLSVGGVVDVSNDIVISPAGVIGLAIGTEGATCITQGLAAA